MIYAEKIARTDLRLEMQQMRKCNHRQLCNYCGNKQKLSSV